MKINYELAFYTTKQKQSSSSIKWKIKSQMGIWIVFEFNFVFFLSPSNSQVSHVPISQLNLLLLENIWHKIFIPQHRYRVQEMSATMALSLVWSAKILACPCTILLNKECRLPSHIDILNLHFLRVSLLMALSHERPSVSIQCLRKKMRKLILNFNKILAWCN